MIFTGSDPTLLLANSNDNEVTVQNTAVSKASNSPICCPAKSKAIMKSDNFMTGKNNIIYKLYEAILKFSFMAGLIIFVNLRS